MKKLFYATLVTSMLLSSTSNVFANQQITVIVDGEKVNYASQPIIQNGSTLVPLRQTFEALDADVKWDGTTQTVTSTKDDTTVSLVIGNKNATKNGKTLSISVAPQIINGSTYVPLRFIAESFGADVEFFTDTQTISIISEPKLFTDYVPYSTGSLETLATDILNGDVVNINGQYYATPEYATRLANTHTAYFNDIAYNGQTDNVTTDNDVVDRYALANSSYDWITNKSFQKFGGEYGFYENGLTSVKTIYLVPDMTEEFMKSTNAEATFSGIRMKMKDGVLYFNTDDLTSNNIKY